MAPLPGSLQVAWKRCGKPTSRCTEGRGPGPYASRRWREGGRQRREYVKAADAEQVRAALEEWRRLHPPAYQARQELAELRRLLRLLDRLGVE